MSFLFQKEMISILIDFFLNKNSPLCEKNSENKRQSVGGRYTSIFFDPLIQTISFMICRLKTNDYPRIIPPTLLKDYKVIVLFNFLKYNN